MFGKRKIKLDSEEVDDATFFLNYAVPAGMLRPVDIYEQMLEFFASSQPKKVVEDFCRQSIGEALQKHIAEQSTWPKMTDNDRLDRAFMKLEHNGIIARQDFSCCQNCGVYEIADIVKEARDTGDDVRGYTFFHQQDTEAAIEGHGICLCYGAIESTDEAHQRIAQKICETCREQGLSVNWNGTVKKRITVAMNWRKRRPDADLDW